MCFFSKTDENANEIHMTNACVWLAIIIYHTRSYSKVKNAVSTLKKCCFIVISQITIFIHSHKSYWCVALIFHFKYNFNLTSKNKSLNALTNCFQTSSFADAVLHPRRSWRYAIFCFMFMRYLKWKKYAYCFYERQNKEGISIATWQRNMWNMMFRLIYVSMSLEHFFFFLLLLLLHSALDVCCVLCVRGHSDHAPCNDHKTNKICVRAIL